MPNNAYWWQILEILSQITEKAPDTCMSDVTVAGILGISKATVLPLLVFLNTEGWIVLTRYQAGPGKRDEYLARITLQGIRLVEGKETLDEQLLLVPPSNSEDIAVQLAHAQTQLQAIRALFQSDYNWMHGGLRVGTPTIGRKQIDALWAILDADPESPIYK